MPDPLELDRPLRGLRVVDTTDATSWSSASAARRSRRRRHPRRRARPRRRRALRDAATPTSAPSSSMTTTSSSRCWATPTSGSTPATPPSTSPTCDACARSSWSCRSARSVTPVRTPRTRRRTRSSTRCAASSPSAASPGRPPLLPPGPARVRGRVGHGRVLRARRGVEPRRHRCGRSSRPLDPGGDDPDHRHAGGGCERASLRARPADHQRGVHRRRRASRVPHRRRVGAPARGELPAMGGAARVGR